jgi:chromosomal replication initiation ATPase DnaA
MLKREEISREIVARKRLTGYRSIREVVKLVSEAFGVREEGILGGGDRSNKARKVALYIAQRYIGLSNEEIGKQFGGIHSSGVSKAVDRVREEMKSDKKLTRLVDEINLHFKA